MVKTGRVSDAIRVLVVTLSKVNYNTQAIRLRISPVLMAQSMYRPEAVTSPRIPQVIQRAVLLFVFLQHVRTKYTTMKREPCKIIE